MVDVGFEPTTKKTHGLSTTPFVKVVGGVLVRLTTCKRLTHKLSLITRDYNILTQWVVLCNQHVPAVLRALLAIIYSGVDRLLDNVAVRSE